VARLARFGGSLMVQVMALVLGTIIAAQGVTILAVYLAPPSSPPTYSLTEIAAALKGQALASDHGRRLVRALDTDPPATRESWRPDPAEAHLATMLGVGPEDVRLRHTGPPPIVIMTAGHPPDGGRPRSTQPDGLRYQGFEPGGPAIRGEFVAGLKQADGRWVVVQPQPELDWLWRVALWVVGGFAVMAPIGWWFAHRITAPLQAFAESAEILGRDPQAAPAPLSGPAEVGVAARALNAMQVRLQRYVRDRVNMIGAISHDLRTPLTRIRFKLERADPALREAVISDVVQMEHMINAVIGFSRDSAAPSAREPLDLASLVTCVIDDAAAFGDAEAEFDHPVIVDGDALALQRLFANLVDNALKYGFEARAWIGEREGEAVVRISDNGPGLAQRDLERVFTPFYRTEEAKGRTDNGVGLGLSIARAVARAHGGDITLNSGVRGLVAEVVLPLARSSAKPPADARYRPQPA
jgi:signal transduction histidine kinase